MGRPRSYERSDVLRKAMRVFWERGYEGANLGLLVDQTGLNRFSLYKEFGSKEGLFHEALELYMGDLKQMESMLTEKPLGLENIRRFVAFTADHQFHHGCFVLNTVKDRHVIAEQSYSRAEAFLAGAEEAIKRNVISAKRRGQLRKNTDSQALARTLIVLNFGMITYSMLATHALSGVVGEVEKLLKLHELDSRSQA